MRTQEKKSTEFYSRIENFLKTIGDGSKDWTWIEEKLQFSHSSVVSWRNGNKTPSLDAINKIAILLKNDGGVNIWSPKQLITDDMKISLFAQVSVATNLPYIFKQYNISTIEMYESKILPKNTILNTLRGTLPNDTTLAAFFKYLTQKTKNYANIQSVQDLIYFPFFGEKEMTFLEIRNKIKIIN